MDKYYITTTLPYVNADPHIGFALELFQADVLARYQKLLGKDVIFNFGTDEHGVKVYTKAKEEGKDPKNYCDEYAVKYEALKKYFNLSSTNFIRTTDEHHIKAAQEFWMRCFKNGDIYKKNYKTKYCIGCELEKTDSELVDGKCPIHPNREIEIREEENYFFKFSKYQQVLLDLYKQRPDFVVPANRLKEIATFVESGLQDFSISRLKSKMPWGIEVPNDPKHVMYVWFDALINYISTLGWPEDSNNFNDFWPGTQVAGKDNLRQQSAMWQAMLASAGLPFSKQIFIHGFLTLDGQKISKSLGNSIDPIDLINKYGVDAVRYYFLAKTDPFEDADFTYKKFEEVYNSDLANGLGNLVARVSKMAENAKLKIDIRANSQTNKGVKNKISLWIPDPGLEGKYLQAIEGFRFNEALNLIWGKISELDRKINNEKPWDNSIPNRNQNKINIFLYNAVLWIRDIAALLEPFLPDTSEQISKSFEGPDIKSTKPLFPRLKLS